VSYTANPQPYLSLVPGAWPAAPAAQAWDAYDSYGTAHDTYDTYDTRKAYEAHDGAPAGGESWRLDALCAETDPEAFFPEKGGSTREAKRVCVGCPVRLQCLEFALENDERFGIWGGLSERERRRVRLQRRNLLSA
jgi:WhiB family redox-sensing transcriptional regulator